MVDAMTLEPGQFLCPFCGAPYTEEMLKAMDGSYGCDTGCEFLRVIISCAACDRAVYVWGTFGSTDTHDDWRESTTPEDIAESLADPREEDPEYPRGTW